ncbi:MAG: hypothetical protein GY750_20725 [Lentisphaerae bacterium]|nr:hypothetical protein [Lentisphaerota bacterium]MCP4103816.1 hypothetical protein [Lentisphaerota bacterium]
MEKAKTKVRIVLPGLPEDQSSWPHIGYDYLKRADEITSALEIALPEIEFSKVVYYSLEEVQAGYENDEKGKYDGYLVYLSCIWTDIPFFYARTAKPVVISNQLYSGCGDYLKSIEIINQENLPIPCISSSDFQDTVDLVKLFDVKKKISSSKILIFSDAPQDAQWGATPEKLDAVEKVFGLEVAIAGSKGQISGKLG